MKPRSWMIVILAIGSIALVIGIILGMHDKINELFHISPTLIEAFEDFIEQYIKGIPIPPPVS
ncbi:MAG: hypothetical protein K9W42_11875 [Candidatus Heimdallarchaeota archaeon]|nr:hypothetical protein [Candidatus Heimdallarchaeota archaeon]